VQPQLISAINFQIFFRFQSSRGVWLTINMAENVPLPRNFKLLEEYDCCIGKKDHASLITGEHAGFINYGLDEAKDDIFLHYWQGMIFGPQG
jgi:hypothetical protein